MSVKVSAVVPVAVAVHTFSVGPRRHYKWTTAVKPHTVTNHHPARLIANNEDNNSKSSDSNTASRIARGGLNSTQPKKVTL